MIPGIFRYLILLLFLYQNYKNMKLFIISIILLGLAFAGIAIKIWGKKEGKFAGTCASQNPYLNKSGEPCSFCGKLPDEIENCDETSTTK
ncbi:hypothetical protein SAMN04488553_2668 [Gramella sp. MAR_2010_147]|nr:hypothetical protein SAMN04488553_2668 [Gramella sp. MAR_2010_147]